MVIHYICQTLLPINRESNFVKFLLVVVFAAFHFHHRTSVTIQKSRIPDTLFFECAVWLSWMDVWFHHPGCFDFFCRSTINSWIAIRFTNNPVMNGTASHSPLAEQYWCRLFDQRVLQRFLSQSVLVPFFDSFSTIFLQMRFNETYARPTNTTYSQT